MTNAPLNGMDRRALMETIEAFGEDPSLAAFTYRVRNRWIDGGASQTDVDGYFGVCEERGRAQPFQILSDGPQVLFGSDSAPNAVEYLLHSIASCVTITFMHLSTARGVRISGVETRLSGDIDLRGFLGLDETVRSGFSRIDVQIAVRSEASRTEIESLCELAWTRSPVFDMVANGVPVTVSPLIETTPAGAA